MILDKDIYAKTAARPITAEIKRSRWSGIGFVLLLTSTTIARVALRSSLDGRRGRGRPNEIWRRDEAT